MGGKSILFVLSYKPGQKQCTYFMMDSTVQPCDEQSLTHVKKYPYRRLNPPG